VGSNASLSHGCMIYCFCSVLCRWGQVPFHEGQFSVCKEESGMENCKPLATLSWKHQWTVSYLKRSAKISFLPCMENRKV
jgi:hypothetical protein